MKTRIITGLAGAAILLGALWWEEWSWTALITFLALLALGEWNKMGNIQGNNLITWTGYILVFALLIFKLPIMFILVLGTLVAIALSLRDQNNKHIEKISYHFFGLFYIAIGFSVSLILYTALGKEFLLFVILLIWMADTFAYFVGYTLGKHKMAPILSPKKTYEGLIGGTVLTVVTSYFISGWLGLELSAFESVGIGFFVAITAPIGDLFESSVKRHFGVKDSGNLLPGHGGILDRFDSFLFVMLSLYMLEFLVR